MGKALLNEVKMNDTEIDDYIISSTVEKKFNQSFRFAVITCSRNILTLFNFQDRSVIGYSITIKRGVSSADEQFEFEGYVEDFSIEGGIVALVCADTLKKSSKVNVTKSWDYDIDTEAGVQSEIFKSLYSDYTDFTASDVSVQNSGTLYIRKKFICNNRDVHTSAQELCDTLDYQQYYKPSTSLVYFEPKAFSSSSETLQVGVNIVGALKWTYKSSKLVNKLKIIGAEQEVETDETGQLNVTTDWNTTSITLNKTPVSVKVYYENANPPTVLLTGGSDTTSGSYDYEVDSDNDKIKWATTVTADYYTKVSYSYMLPTPVVLQDIASQESYYKSEKTIFKKDLETVDDVELYGRNYLKRYSTPFRSTKVRVFDATDLEPGQSIRVIDTSNNIDDYFLIKNVKINRPYKFDEVEIGDELLRTFEFGSNVDERIRTLEEEFGKSTDLLVHAIDLNRSIAIERRDITLGKRTIESGVLYWDSDVQGDWDDFNWGDDSEGSYTTRQLLPGNNQFKELIYDEKYKHSNTTATWSSTAGTIVFTDGQIYESELMSKGIDYPFLRVVLGSTTTANLKIEVSSDGKSNWEEVSHDTRTEISKTSTAGTAVKMTASANTTISNGINASNQITDVAIRVYHEEV